MSAGMCTRMHRDMCGDMYRDMGKDMRMGTRRTSNVHTQTSRVGSFQHVCTHLCTCVCVRIPGRIPVRMSVLMHACTPTRTHVYIDVYAHACTHVYTCTLPAPVHLSLCSSRFCAGTAMPQPGHVVGHADRSTATATPLPDAPLPSWEP